MNLADIIIILVVLLVTGVAVFYIRKEKKQGKCVGCPYAKECAAKKAAGSACHGQDENK